MIQHETYKYKIAIDEKKGTVKSLIIDDIEYVNRTSSPLFQMQVRDDDMMINIIVDSYGGELIECVKNENIYCLKYGNFQIENLFVNVYVEFTDDVKWSIDVAHDGRCYIEWIAFPMVAIPNDLRCEDNNSQVVWNFSREISVDKNITNRIMLNGQQTSYDYSEIPSLCDVYKDYFRVAVAVEPRDTMHYKDLITTQFNELTIENRMKPTNIHPKEDIYSWIGTDAILDFAEEHGMKVRGHGLVYEKVMPDWFFVDENGNRASKQLVMERLEKHIKTIVGRYKGRIHSYDVVNEIFGHEDWDTRNISAICGVEYVPLVYKWAHEADPDAILILNDNYHDIPKKRLNIFNYVKKWIAEGAPIHGIGFQDHLFLDTSLEAVEETLKLFSTIPNFKIYVTELDICAYKFDDRLSVYPDYMVDEILELSAKKYAALFDLYRKYSDHIETIGFWNPCDKRTWLDEWYVCGRKHYPLPFGYDGEPRKSFWSIIDVDKKLPRWTNDTKIPVIRNNNFVIDEETNILVLDGRDDSEKYAIVKAELYTNFHKKQLLCSETKDISGSYHFEFNIDTEKIYDGSTSPDYILEVTDNKGNKTTDYFTYYSKKQREKYYTVTDSFYDFSKTYNMQNCVLESEPKKCNKVGVKPLWFWGNGLFGPAKITYNIPEKFSLKLFEVDMYTENSKLYKVLYSNDDENYYEAEVCWECVSDSEGIQHFLGTLTKLPDGAKYIMLDLSTGFSTYWRSYEGYLANVKLYTELK